MIKTNRVLKLLALSTITFGSLYSYDDTTLMALEPSESKLINEECIISVNSTEEEIIESIIYGDINSIDIDISIGSKLINISNYLDFEKISRFELVDWLCDNSVLNETQKIECYCDLIDSKNFENVICLESVYSELLEYQTSLNTNNNVNNYLVLNGKLNSVLSNPYENSNTRSIDNEAKYSSENFRIHYDSNETTEQQAIEVAEFFEEIRDEFIDMGFEEPILELQYSGYQVYLDPDPNPDNSSTLAVCTKKSVTTKTCASYITIYNFNDLEQGHVKESITHEYFHAIQNAYNQQSTWFKEACANWAATEVSEQYNVSLGWANDFIRNSYDESIYSTNGYGAVLLPLTIEKKYGGYSAIRSIYEEYNNNGFNLNFSQLKNVISNGIVSNGYSAGTFDDAYVDMATYLIDPIKHFATVINKNTSLVDINTNDYILSNSNNNTTIVDNDIIKSYASSYYYFEVDDSLLGDSTLTLTFDFSFDISGAQIQLYTVDYSNNEYISYNVVYNNNKSITVQNVGTSVEKIFFVVSNLNVSSEIEMDIDVSFTHTHNHLNGCTSNGAISHTCICSCGHTYTTDHTFKPFSNGNKCTGCGFFTTGPVITPIMGIGEEEPEEE